MNTLIVNGKGDEREVKAQTIIFPDKKVAQFDPDKTLEVMIEHQELKKKSTSAQIKATATINTIHDWIAVNVSGDWHFGGNIDYQAFADYMKTIENTEGLFMMVIGDERDNFCISKLMSASYESLASPQEQAEYIRTLLLRLDGKNKILGRCGGNHDHWTWMQSGIDLEGMWYKDMKSPLLELGGFVHVIVNGVEYVFYLHHGKSRFNSNLNPTHPVRQAFNFQGPFDVGALGHTHVAEIGHGYRWNDEFTMDYILLRTGTFKIFDDYARSVGLPNGQPCGTTVLLNTKTKHMIPFLKLCDAVTVMEALNRR